MRRLLRIMAAALSAAAIAALAGGATLYLHPHAQAATTRAPYTWFTGTKWMAIAKPFTAHNFTLRDQYRHPVSLAQFRGNVVLLSFTSAVCKQQCPLVGRTVTQTERLLGAKAKDTVLLNVSVDPEADSAQSVAAFAAKMGWKPYRWYYVWGPRAVMKPIWKAYGIYVPTPPPIFKPGLNIIHTAATALIDQSGHVRGFFPYPFLASYLANGARDLLSGKA